jgi:hypothetical protein
MCSRLAAAASLLLLLGGAVACDETTVAPASDTLQPSSDVSECVPSACAPSGAAAQPSFKIGTNEAGVIDVEAFEEAVDNSEVPVILGGQGAWMVVLAVATNELDCCVDRINIRAQLATVDGSEVLGMINYRRRPLLAGDDGMRYLMNTWMVLGDEAKWKDKSAVLTLSVEPYGGGPLLEKTVTVTLRKDTSVTAPGTDGAPASVRIGTHPLGVTNLGAFLDVEDGDELFSTPLADGTHGLVLAAATQSLASTVETVDVSVEVSPVSGAIPLANLTSPDRPLVRDMNGDAYALDVPVPLGDEASWRDVPVSLTVGVQPSGGAEPVILRTIIVTLRKQAAQ